MSARADGVKFGNTAIITSTTSGNFNLTQTDPESGISGTCTFEFGSTLTGNFNSGAVTATLSRRPVSGSCPSDVACDAVFSGTLTKISAAQSESESLPFKKGTGSSIQELIDTLLD